MKKVIYVISDIDKALAFEWVALGLNKKIDLSFVLIGKKQSKFSIFLKTNGIRYHEISNENFPSRTRKWLALFRILLREKPDTVHTHLWNANLLGLSASWLLGVKQRIYTRHHATTHYREFPSGRKWDRLCNKLATHIVAISKNVQEILIDWDKASEKKIVLIYHGFDFEYFTSMELDRAERLRDKYALSKEDFPVIGVISRYMEWKGIQYIIPAFAEIKREYPAAKLVLANAHGEYEENIKILLRTLPKDSFIEIKFEEDLAALYKLFDVFVHVPVDAHAEAFGQTYIEALVTQTPSIFTLSGIAREFIKHHKNAWVVSFENSREISEAIKGIVQNEKLREDMKRYGEKSIQQFSLQQYLLALENLYTDL